MSKKKKYIKIDKPIDVGDLVRCVREDDDCKPGDIRKVDMVGEGSKNFFYTNESGYPRWLKSWEPVREGTIVNENSREEMARAVAEMVVELLDKCEWSDTLSLENYRSFDNSISVRWNLIDLSEAKLHPNDTWDTLTGVFVALSKATGRKLPDWIYGEVK